MADNAAQPYEDAGKNQDALMPLCETFFRAAGKTDKVQELAQGIAGSFVMAEPATRTQTVRAVILTAGFNREAVKAGITLLEEVKKQDTARKLSSPPVQTGISALKYRLGSLGQ